jgi:hypothetical protein
MLGVREMERIREQFKSTDATFLNAPLSAGYEWMGDKPKLRTP